MHHIFIFLQLNASYFYFELFIFLHAMSPFYYGQILSFTTCKGSPTLLMGRGLSRPSTCRSSRVPCSTPTRDGILAARPRSSSEYTSRACQAERVCIRRTTGRCCRNSVSGRGRTWNTIRSTHTRAVQQENPEQLRL